LQTTGPTQRQRHKRKRVSQFEALKRQQPANAGQEGRGRGAQNFPVRRHTDQVLKIVRKGVAATYMNNRARPHGQLAKVAQDENDDKQQCLAEQVLSPWYS
jgi:hypothetical protein